MTRRVLLICGLASTVLYVVADMVGALSYPGYDYLSQAISEMSAVGAPTAGLLAPFYLAYALLFLAFGAGVWSQVGAASRLRITAGCLVAVALLALFAWPFFPMHMRGAERSFSDTAHLALGAIDVLLLVSAIAFASGAFGRGFRIYSWASVVAMLVFGGATALLVPRVDAGLTTSYLGLLERLSLLSYLLWIAILSVKLVRVEARAPGKRPVDPAPLA